MKLSIGTVATVAWSLVFGLPVVAQLPAPRAKPADFGLILPRYAPRPGNDRRVLLQDETEQLVVAKVRFEVGDRMVVLMPDGRYVSVLEKKTTRTDRPFEAATKEAIVNTLTKGEFRDFRSNATAHYVFIYNTSEPFQVATSRILESMYPSLMAYCKRQELPVHDPETPLIVVMFRTEDEFQAYQAMPPEVVAYYDSVSNRVVMYEQSTLAEVAPMMAVKQSISTIAHEGVHQILNNIGVQQRLSKWPLWIAEGLAEYFAPTQVDRRIQWKGVGLVNDLRIYGLGEYLKQRPPDAPPGSLLRQTIEARSLTSTGYASAWAITHFLAKYRQDQFFAYLRDVSKTPPLVGGGNNLELFTKHFGDDYAELESDVLRSMKKLPYVDPIANQPHYVAVIDTNRVRKTVVTTSPASVRQWQQKTLTALPPKARATARMAVRAFPNKQLAERHAQAIRGG